MHYCQYVKLQRNNVHINECGSSMIYFSLWTYCSSSSWQSKWSSALQHLPLGAQQSGTVSLVGATLQLPGLFPCSLAVGSKMLMNSTVCVHALLLSLSLFPKMMRCFLPEEWIMEFLFLADLLCFSVTHFFSFPPSSLHHFFLPLYCLFVFACILFWECLLAIESNSYIFPASSQARRAIHLRI